MPTVSLSPRRLSAALGLPLALAVVVWAAGACADFEGPTDPAAGLPNVVKAAPSFSADIQPIFTNRCAIGGCHSVRSQLGGLVLAAGVAHQNIVNKPSATDPTRQIRVVPGNADTSLVYRVLLADPARRSGLPRMPLALKPLTENQIQNIRNWINTGAPNN